jgi:hypothetical protein
VNQFEIDLYCPNGRAPKAVKVAPTAPAYLYRRDWLTAQAIDTAYAVQIFRGGFAMPRIRKRPNEPIAPANIPGERLDPKIPEDVELTDDETVQADEVERVESDEEQQARESEKAFDQAITRIPPG